MDKLRAFAVLFVIQCIMPRITGKTYGMHFGNFTMDEAADKCELATPAFHYTESGIRLNVTTDEFYPDDGEKFWLGYVKVFQAFQYRGCVSTSVIKDYITHQLNMREETAPGTCYSFCGNYGIIGLSGPTCYCLPSFSQSTALLSNEGCSQKCFYQDAPFCGSTDKKFVSVYKQMTYLNHNDDTKSLCLAHNTRTMEYTWSNCSENHRYVCQQEKTDKNIYNEWSTSMQHCLKDGNLPALRATNFILRPQLAAGITLWIGEVRNQVITTDSVNSDSVPMQRGYLVLEKDGVFHLRFDNYTAQHNVMCKGVEEETTTGSSQSSSSTIAPDDEVFTGAKTTTSVSDVTIPATDTKHYSGTTNDGSANEEDFLPLIVGVSVSVPVVVILVVILICVVKKRIRTNSNKRQPGHEMETRDEMRTEHNNTSAETDRYFILEPTGHGNTRQMAPPRDDVVYDTAEERVPLENDNRAPLRPAQNDNRMNNRPASDDTYNVTTDNAGHRKQPMENIYNKTEAVDDTYDHTGATPSKVHQTDNVYNMTESGDIYNQTGVSPDRTVQTDNVYNITETDDTYSHTDKKPNCASQTDNVYN